MSPPFRRSPSPAISSRRHFLKISALATAAGAVPSVPFFAASPARRRKGPGEKLNIALIGVSGRGRNTIRDFLQLEENVIALCDVDPARLAEGAGIAAPKYSDARRYHDYRTLLEKETELDAVVVTTPDHMHAPISLLAMSRGLHVFCEKPLARTVGEARRMRELARTTGVVTQMGTQGSASHGLRRAVEVIRAGVLGNVREVHVWTDRTPRLQRDTMPKEMPAGMNWNTWCGVAEPREFSRDLHPFAWRWWTGFGTGPLGDMGCHLTNIAFRALDLVDPSHIEPTVGEPPRPGMFGEGSRIVYRFPERHGRPAVVLTWYDGGKIPDTALLEAHGILQQFGVKVAPSEKLIIGDKGVLYGDSYLKLHGEQRFNGLLKHEACLAVPESIARAKQQGTLGHYSEWVEACKGNGTTYAGFDVAAAHTEMVTLGTVALQLGRKIRWDAATMRVPDEPAADVLLRPTYRPGFTIT